MVSTSKFKHFVSECIRILRLARKPTKDEYMVIAKITGLGMVIIGVLGMVITIFAELVGLR